MNLFSFNPERPTGEASLNLESHRNIVLLFRNNSRNRTTGSFSSQSYLFSSLNSQFPQRFKLAPTHRSQPCRAYQSLQKDVGGGHPSYSPADLPHQGWVVESLCPLRFHLIPFPLVPCEGFPYVLIMTHGSILQNYSDLSTPSETLRLSSMFVRDGMEGAQPAKSQCFSTSNSSRILNAFNATSFPF